MRCCVTGGAGFIGSNIVEKLLERGAEVVVLDDLSTGSRANVEEFAGNGGFRFIEGSVTDTAACRAAVEGADYVFHEAALVSVPQSVKDPVMAHDINVTGTMNMFLAARDAGVKRVVWASSTSVYGNSPELPNREDMPLCPLSPYAATKAAGEMYGRALSETAGISVISLRYYNVFGRRQDPFSPYAAVIPLFVSAMLKGKRPVIFGDGEQTRDFVYVGNVADANLKAAFDAPPEASGRAFNIGCGTRISINQLFNIIARELDSDITPEYAPPRAGDVLDSVADISAAREAFGYDPAVSVEDGLVRSLEWYKENLV